MERLTPEQIESKKGMGLAIPEGCRLILSSEIENLFVTIEAQQQEINRLQQWVNDLQAGMYVNCVYCGHRYGMENDTPVAMADVLKGHIEHCPKHPMSKLKKEIDRLKDENASIKKWNACEEQAGRITQLEKLAKDLYFAYINKDPDCPHSFETKAIEQYKIMLGGKEDV